MTLDEIIARVEALAGPDRDLDADIAEHVYGWKPTPVGPDCNGENACEVLTENGEPFPKFEYPPRGKIHRAFHVPAYTRDPRDWDVEADYFRKRLLDDLRAKKARRA